MDLCRAVVRRYNCGMHGYGGTRGWREIIVVAALSGCGGGGEGDGSSGSSGPGTSTAQTTGEPDPTTSSASDPTTDAPTTAPATTSTTDPPDSTSSVSDSDGTSDGGSTVGEETGPPPPATASVFLAQGHYGRTTISCDDGKTWIQNKSADDAIRCFENDVDCDHNEFAARGIAWGDQQIVMTWGWGHPGTLVQSEDAANFAVTMSETPTYADVAYGNGRFVANNSTTKISDDGGLTWQDGGPLNINMNTRAIEWVPQSGGWFIVTGESGENRTIVRSPDGVTWTPASTRPPECGTYVIGIGHGGDNTIVVSGKGHVCRSADAGDTWTLVPIADRFTSPPVWTGSEFYVYEGNVLHRSATGETWESEPLTPNDVSIGAVTRSPAGTFVAANDGWMTWYEKQRFFRSTDGKTWEVLPEGAFVGSHPINFIAHGTVAPGAGCPAN